MNQILITEKLYVTPELKRKKRMYKFNFFLSVFLVCILFSYYIYAEYDRNKNEEISKEILANIDLSSEDEAEEIADDTTVRIDNNVLIVTLDETQANNEEIDITKLAKDVENYIHNIEEQSNENAIVETNNNEPQTPPAQPQTSYKTRKRSKLYNKCNCKHTITKH